MSTSYKDTADTWFRPAWWTVTSEWLCEAIEAQETKLAGPVAVVKIRPWAAVWRVPTDRGALFLKAVAPSQWHEPALSVFLSGHAPHLAPRVVAADRERGLLLTADSGPSLCDLPPYALEKTLPALEQSLRDLAELQRALIPAVDDMLALGVVDRRPQTLVSQITALLDRADVRAPDDPQTAGEAELARVREALPAIDKAGRALTSGPIPMSLDHGDLYLHHILPRPEGVTILDWGDATVTHPFTIVLPLFHQLRTAYDMDATSPLLARLRRAYLTPWAAYGSTIQVDSLLDTALVVGNLNRALNYVHALGPHSARLTPSLRRMYTQGVTLWLRETMAGLDGIDQR